MKKYIFLYSLILLIIISLVLGSIFLVNQYKQDKKAMLDKSIIAPYYEKAAFKKPGDLINIATTGAMTKQIKIPIIMYHYVEYVKDINDTVRKRLDITPDLFEGQLKSLHQANYKTYFVKDIQKILDDSIIISSKPIVLTFDDGYEDFYSVVYPILKKYQMKATVYVIVDYIGRKGFLSETELTELAGSGLVEIGAHTLDHVYLKNSGYISALKQINESKTKLEKLLNIKVETFAYPYGAFDQQTLTVVKEASFSAAVSVIPGSLQSKDNLFYLYRIRPGIFTPETIVKVLENYNK